MSVCDDADDRSHLPSIPRLWLELETVLGFLVLGLGPGACPGWYFFFGGGGECSGSGADVRGGEMSYIRDRRGVLHLLTVLLY